MIELLENGSTSTPLRGGLVAGNTLGTLDLAPAIAPLRDKKISKECNKMLDTYIGIPTDGDWDTIEYQCKPVGAIST